MTFVVENTTFVSENKMPVMPAVWTSGWQFCAKLFIDLMLLFGLLELFGTLCAFHVCIVTVLHDKLLIDFVNSQFLRLVRFWLYKPVHGAYNYCRRPSTPSYK